MIAPAGAPRTQETKRPATRLNRLAAINACGLSPKASTRQTSIVRRMLEQIEICSNPDGSGSHIRQATLASRLGISERTLRRWLTLAVEEGLLECEDSWTIRGRSRTIKIQWARVIDGPSLQRQLFFDFESDRTGRNDRKQADKMSGCNKEDLVLGVSRDPLPPSASEPQAEPDPPRASEREPGGGSGEEWEEVRELMEARGVSAGGACQAVNAARRSGASVWQAHAVLRFFDRQSPRFGAGALQLRMKRLRPGVTPEANFERDPEPLARLGLWPFGHEGVRSLKGLERGPEPAREPREPSVDVRAEKARRRALFEQSRDALRSRLGDWWDALSIADRLEVAERLDDGGLWSRVLQKRGRVTSDQWEFSDVAGLEELERSGRILDLLGVRV